MIESALAGSNAGSVHLGMSEIDKHRISPAIYWGAAALALLLGYLDLWRGGETLAPLLLIIGYVVLVPLAILKG